MDRSIVSAQPTDGAVTETNKLSAKKRTQKVFTGASPYSLDAAIAVPDQNLLWTRFLSKYSLVTKQLSPVVE